MAPLVCARCGEEVRFGFRATVRTPEPLPNGRGAWMHRDPDADHVPVFGRVSTAADELAREIELDRVRTRLDGDGNEMTYTTRDWKSKKAISKEAEGEEESVWDGTLPAPEVVADLSVIPWPIVKDAQFPGGLVDVVKPAIRAGLEIVRLTHARGPWLRQDSQQPTTSETWVLGLRASELDYGPHAGVACWRNPGSGWKFEHSFLVVNRGIIRASAAELKNWIKEAHRG